MRLTWRVSRLEARLAAPGTGPDDDAETVAHWASLWIETGMEKARATTLAQEFLEYCQTTGQTVTIAVLNRWAHCQTEA